MKALWVLRHAKASDTGRGSRDHERPLTAKGERQCAMLREHLADGLGPPQPRPRLIVSSSARRALSTAQGVLPVLDGATLEVTRTLYSADVDEVVAVVRAFDDSVESAMVVGHNPTFEDLVLDLHDPVDDAGADRLEAGFPTAALAVLTFDVANWRAIAADSGQLVELFLPGRE